MSEANLIASDFDNREFQSVADGDGGVVTDIGVAGEDKHNFLPYRQAYPH